MTVKETRVREAGGFHGTESRVIRLDDTDQAGNQTTLPEGAVVVSDDEPTHDWTVDARQK